MKITEYPSIKKCTEDNVLLVDGNNGTKKMLITDAVLSALDLLSTELHRTVFRGKNLGTSLTPTQKARIQDGTFEDLWLGDYWVINDVTWRIVDFDYWFNHGFNHGNTAFTNHHLVIMPDKALLGAAMNSTDVTTGGYFSSLMRSTSIPTASTIIQKAFPSSVLTHRDAIPNAVDASGGVTGFAWVDASVSLPSTVMMLGFPKNNGYTINTVQFSLFAACPKFISNRACNQWLMDASNGTRFWFIDSSGGCNTATASTVFGVRPAFPIG